MCTGPILRQKNGSAIRSIAADQYTSAMAGTRWKVFQARTGSMRLVPSQLAGSADRRLWIRHSSFNNVERLAVIVSVQKVMAWTWFRQTTAGLVRSGTQQMVAYLFKEGCDADIVDHDCHCADHRLGGHRRPRTTGDGRAKSEGSEGRAAIEAPATHREEPR